MYKEGTADQRVDLQPSTGYVLFERAETLGMTVGKLLTGKDMPLSNMEMVLLQTYYLAKRAIEKRRSKKR